MWYCCPYQFCYCFFLGRSRKSNGKALHCKNWQSQPKHQHNFRRNLSSYCYFNRVRVLIRKCGLYSFTDLRENILKMNGSIGGSVPWCSSPPPRGWKPFLSHSLLSPHFLSSCWAQFPWWGCTGKRAARVLGITEPRFKVGEADNNQVDRILLWRPSKNGKGMVMVGGGQGSPLSWGDPCIVT